jgi:HEAT repeat protein
MVKSISEIINQFESGDVGKIEKAIVEISQHPERGLPIILKSIVKLINSPNKYIRYHAARAMKYIENPDAIDYLELLLDDEEEMVINSAISALSHYNNLLPEKIIHKLIKIWYSAKSQDLQRTILKAFEEIRSEITISPVLKKYDELPESVKPSAIDALGNINHDKVYDFIIQHLHEDSFEIRLSLINAIGNLQIIKAATYLIESIENEDDDDLIIALLHAIGKLKLKEAIPVIKDYAELDQIEETRLACFQALGEIGSEDALPILETYTEDESIEISKQVVEAIGKIYSLQSYTILMDKVVNNASETNQALKARAKELADHIKNIVLSKEAHYELVDSLGSEDYYTRIKASRRLIKLPSPPIKELILALESNNELKAAYSAEVLGLIKEFSSADALRKIYNNRNGEVRAFAGWALAQMKLLK